LELDHELTPSPVAERVLSDTVRARATLRRNVVLPRPIVLVWLPPEMGKHPGYFATSILIQERLIADAPSTVVQEAPFPASPDDPDIWNAVLADLSIILAPGTRACENALRLAQDTLAESRTRILATDLPPEDAERLAQPMLTVLTAGEDEPGGLFDEVSATLARVRDVAFWQAVEPDAPSDSPLALLAEHRASIIAASDDGCAYLLALIDRSDPLGVEALLTQAGDRDLFAPRLEALAEAGCIEFGEEAVELTDRGEILLAAFCPTDGTESAADTELARLFDAARAGSQEALGRILQAGGEEARRVARRRLGSALSARVESTDISQSVIREVLKVLDRFEFRGEREWKSYLRRLVENKIRAKADYFGAQKRDSSRERSIDHGSEEDERPRAPRAPTPRPSEILLEKEEYARLERALDRMPQAERDVIILRVFDGRSHREIAKLLKRPSEAAVHKLYGRALARLARLMGRD
jgi:RNA polymerase sigma-70 factor (ECF subfamily)